MGTEDKPRITVGMKQKNRYLNSLKQFDKRWCLSKSGRLCSSELTIGGDVQEKVGNVNKGRENVLSLGLAANL